MTWSAAGDAGGAGRAAEGPPTRSADSGVIPEASRRGAPSLPRPVALSQRSGTQKRRPESIVHSVGRRPTRPARTPRQSISRDVERATGGARHYNALAPRARDGIDRHPRRVADREETSGREPAVRRSVLPQLRQHGSHSHAETARRAGRRSARRVGPARRRVHDDAAGACPAERGVQYATASQPDGEDRPAGSRRSVARHRDPLT
jgi:hypothetical protein